MVFNDNKIDEYIKKSQSRLQNFISYNCMNCKNKIVDQNELKGNKKQKVLQVSSLTGEKYYTVVVSKEMDREICYSNHIICESCISAVRKDIMSTLKNQNEEVGNLKRPIKPNPMPVKCAYCLVSHTVEFKYLKEIFKSESCCCNIL
jgi:hypothetical protein